MLYRQVIVAHKVLADRTIFKELNMIGVDLTYIEPKGLQKREEIAQKKSRGDIELPVLKLDTTNILQSISEAFQHQVFHSLDINLQEVHGTNSVGCHILISSHYTAFDLAEYLAHIN